YKAKYYSKLEEANLFQSRIKSLEKELSLTQKYSSKKNSKIMSLKTELEGIKSKLASKINKLERLGALCPASQKSDTISEELAWPRSVITGGDEENKSLTKYFIRKKIDTIIPAHTDNGNIRISKSPKINNKIQPSSEICPKVSDTEISRAEDPCFEETPKGLQCNKNSTISSNETYSQISIGEVEAIFAI
ncbi:40711_t:CDS:1, partial [Gigaspora margarita]